MSANTSEKEAVQKIYDLAGDLINNQGLSREDALAELQRQGIDEESASIVINNVQKTGSGTQAFNAYKSFAFGLLWIAIGVILTLSNIGAIFYGAIVYGAILIIKGIVLLAANK